MTNMVQTDAEREYAAWAREERARLAGDPHRPRYHYQPPSNWMNDPNGVLQFEGEYHLFYQYNPHGPLWGDIHWGHAVSTDLVHWTDLPVALAPTPGGPDEGGCWSGCAVDNDGVPTIIYTGVRGEGRKIQRVCIATSRDRLRTLEKWPGNPVVPERPPGLDLVQYRDPCVWREDDGWHMLVGSGIVGQGGTALLYRSPDLIEWEYMHPLVIGDVNRRDPVWTGPMWECPDFFPLGEKWVLVPSVWDKGTLYTAYAIGAYADHTFTPETEGVLDAGKWYAPQSTEDDQGRRLMWGWLREGRTKEAQTAAGWSGVMSLPRLLFLHPNGDLGSAPAPELEVLRGAHRRVTDRAIAPGERDLLPGVTGAYAEIDAAIALGDAATVGLTVRRSPGGEEETRIVYERASGRLWIARSRSTLDPESDDAPPEGPCTVAADGILRLRVFLDGSAIEVFANERTCISERIYPARPDSLGVDLFAEGGAARLRSLDIWQMASIW